MFKVEQEDINTNGINKLLLIQLYSLLFLMKIRKYYPLLDMGFLVFTSLELQIHRVVL